MQQTTDTPIVPHSPRWSEFLGRLSGPEGCDFKGERWTCHGDLRFTRSILGRMGLSEASIRVSVTAYQAYSSYCDCEVAFIGSG